MIILLRVIGIICDLATILILIRIVLSWYPSRRISKLANIIHSLTEPILVPLRRIIPRLGPLDLSPLVAIILIQLIPHLILFLLGLLLHW